MAKHNASIYGVAERIDFVVGDASQLLPHMRAHVCLLSPPWGGIADVAHPPNAPSHSSAFRLTQLAQPCCGLRLFDLAARCAPSIAYYLPADTAEDELARLAMRHTSRICDKVGMRWGGGKRKSARVRAILAVFHARPPAWLVGAMQGATTAVHSRSWDVATDADWAVCVWDTASTRGVAVWHVTSCTSPYRSSVWSASWGVISRGTVAWAPGAPPPWSPGRVLDVRWCVARCVGPLKNLLVGTRHVVTHIMRTDTNLCTVYYLLRSMIGRGRKRGASTRSRRRLDRASAPACKPIELPMTCGCDQATS